MYCFFSLNIFYIIVLLIATCYTIPLNNHIYLKIQVRAILYANPDSRANNCGSDKIRSTVLLSYLQMRGSPPQIIIFSLFIFEFFLLCFQIAFISTSQYTIYKSHILDGNNFFESNKIQAFIIYVL